MKNLKKVLAMVLAFACTFTMFAGAKVFEDVPAGSDYSEAITMLSDLGIIQGKDDGKYHPEDTITRAEACALIARMMTGDPNVSQYVGAQNFTDVAKGSWKDSAIGYCYINNIVIGVGNNKFEPDRAITDAEFITMVVRAMGYETPDMVQGYPYTYMSNAQAIGLMDGVDMVANTDALRGEDAQVIYNALFADYARGAKLVNTTHGTSVEQYPTLAESVWGLERAAVGVWQRSTSDDETMELTTCKAHTWVITGKSLTVGNVDMFEAYPIEDDETKLYDHGKKSDNEPYYFTYNGDMANIADLKGYQVELWGMGAHDEPELTEVTDENGDRKKVYVYSSDWDINAIKTVNGQTKYDYTPADENLPDVDLDEIRGFVGGTIDSDINWGNDHMSKSDVEDALETKNSASYRVVDWDSDGTADFITGDIYKYYEVKAVTSKTIRLGGFDGKTEFVLDLDGETDVEIDGQDYTVTAEFPDDLEEGDVIQVSTDEVVGKKKIDSTWTVEKVEPETKEITSISSKKGVEFDDELIDVAHEDYSFDPTNETYNDLNEDSADLWDLYLDNNGFIIKMEESEGAYNGYIFVTGADQGDNNSTGNRRTAQISGVNDQNEYMEDLELTRNANVDVWDGDEYVDGYDDREFNSDAGNIKGRVFKYTLNDDGDVTRLVEVACENTSANYSYNEDTRAVDALSMNNNRTDRNWLQKASVIFAVEINTDEWEIDRDTAGTSSMGENLVNGTTLTMGDGDDQTRDDRDIDPDNVIAVDYTDVPDISNINTASKTMARGVAYNNDTSKDEIETVVLGVNSLNDFKSTSTKVALVTGLDYNMKGDKAETYDITAYVNGEEETEFNTIDVDDMTVNDQTKDQDSIIDRINEEIEGTKANNYNDAKNGVYAELRFNKDGKVTEMNVINDTNTFAGTDAEYNVAEADAHYTVVRAVVNLRGDNDRIMVTPTKAIWDPEAEEMKLESVGNADFDTYYELGDDTAYFKLTDSLVLSNGDYMNAYKDAFDEDLAVETGDKADLISWIDSDNIEYEDDYTVADVIVDSTAASEAESVVAVYYHEDQVGEYGMLDGDIEVNNAEVDPEVIYGDDVVVDVNCNDKNLLDGSEEITLYTVSAGSDGKEVTTEVKTVKADSYNFGKLDAGKYYVKATGENKATEKNDRQLIDSMYFEVQKATFSEFARITVDPKNNQQVVLSHVGVEGLQKENFTVYQNSTELTDDMYEMKYDERNATYNFLIDAGVAVTDDFTIVISHKNYNEKPVDYKGEEAEVAPTWTISDVKATGAKTLTFTTSEPVDLEDAEAVVSFAQDGGNVSTTADREKCTVTIKQVNPLDATKYEITISGDDVSQWDHYKNGVLKVEITSGDYTVSATGTVTNP